MKYVVMLRTLYYFIITDPKYSHNSKMRSFSQGQFRRFRSGLNVQSIKCQNQNHHPLMTKDQSTILSTLVMVDHLFYEYALQSTLFPHNNLI